MSTANHIAHESALLFCTALNKLVKSVYRPKDIGLNCYGSLYAIWS